MDRDDEPDWLAEEQRAARIEMLVQLVLGVLFLAACVAWSAWGGG